LKYIGDIKDNKENGVGELYILKFNRIYKGQFIDGKKSGRGIQYNEKFIYDGLFDNDKRNGEGVFFRIGDINEFEKYIGNWKDDKKCGYGQQYDDFKLVYEGNFLEDKYHGDGVLYHVNGYYHGKLADGKKNGKGIFYYTEGKLKDLRLEASWNFDDKYGCEYRLLDKDDKIIEEGIYGKK